METKRKCDELTRLMRKDGWPAMCIHGDKEQKERDWVLNEFKNGSTSILSQPTWRPEAWTWTTSSLSSTTTTPTTARITSTGSAGLGGRTGLGPRTLYSHQRTHQKLGISSRCCQRRSRSSTPSSRSWPSEVGGLEEVEEEEEMEGLEEVVEEAGAGEGVEAVGDLLLFSLHLDCHVKLQKLLLKKMSRIPGTIVNAIKLNKIVTRI